MDSMRINKSGCIGLTWYETRNILKPENSVAFHGNFYDKKIPSSPNEGCIIIVTIVVVIIVYI